MNKNNFNNLQNLLSRFAEDAKNVEKACLAYGKTKSELQLEIYRLIEDNHESNEIALFIKECIEKVEQIDQKTNKQKTGSMKFFREE